MASKALQAIEIFGAFAEELRRALDGALNATSVVSSSVTPSSRASRSSARSRRSAHLSFEQAADLRVDVELRRGAQHFRHRDAERGVEAHERVVALVQLAERRLRFFQRRLQELVEDAALLVAEERTDRDRRLAEVCRRAGGSRGMPPGSIASTSSRARVVIIAWGTGGRRR
jgi:hypothetical protein